MSNGQLKALAERIERLMDERDGIQSDIRDIYAEAKSNGFVPKVLRKAITRKRMDPNKRDEEDTILDLYEDALSPSMRKAVQMAARNATAREIEAETGIDQATVARSVSLNKKSETPEITTAVLDTQRGEGSERADITTASGASLASDAEGNFAHEGEDDGSNSNSEGRGSEGLQPERESGRGRDQGGNGGARHEDGGHPRPERRAGGPRGGSGDHKSPDGQHVVRSGSDQGSVIGGRGVGSVSTPQLGAVGAKPRVASDNDWPEMPAGLRRVRA